MSVPSTHASNSQSGAVHFRRIVLWLGLLAALLLEPLRFAPVHGSSMEPTLVEGDLVCFQVLPSGQLPQRGELVVFHSPTRPGKMFVKRLVGLPGDELRFAHGQLVVNGLPLALPTSAVERNYSLSTRVPAGCFFAIGDHASVSYDSREFGSVRQDLLVGRLLGF
ncbi:MAG: signal peptidase I [Planctomycetes bacterium]|nr:signal peptidase I [Planctomycetota bacterium]